MPGPPAHPMPNPNSLIPLKRRASADVPQELPPTPAKTSAHERGRVTCEACGEAISFKDGANGTFTLEHWDAHRLKCGSQADAMPPTLSQPAPALSPRMHSPPQPAPLTQTVRDGPPPPKRRRAKRTEEERIQYLRSDPFIAQFEAYRVLCGSCNKWIRLRPNSTYCSIPWDSHRKSCLAKNGKLNNITGGPPAQAHTTSVIPGISVAVAPIQSAPPIVGRAGSTGQAPKQINRFESDGLEDADAEYDEDVEAGDASASVSGHNAAFPPPTPHQLSLASSASTAMPPPAPPVPSPKLAAAYPGASPAARSRHSGSPLVEPSSAPAQSFPPQAFVLPASLASPSALSSSPEQQAHNIFPERGSPSPSTADDPPLATHDTRTQEPRRRNADQRAAALRADPLLGDVEPNRVFCALCQKWVQLRQDSTFCAYPWVQHRTKCVKRHHRRSQKAAELAEARQRREDEKQFRIEQRARERELARRGAGDGAAHARAGRAPSEAESDEGMSAEDARRVAEATGWTVHHGPGGSLHDEDGEERPRREGHPGREVDELVDDPMGAGEPRPASHPPARPQPAAERRLADLDSPTGRLAFIAHSIEYLFGTTYEGTDELSADALAHYLNAAMPAEKHEEFDGVEVQRAFPDLPGEFARRLKVVHLPEGNARLALAR